MVTSMMFGERLAELRSLPDALGPLVRSRGVLGALSVLAHVAKAKALAPPFRGVPIPPQADPARERHARAQAEPVVLCYRALRRTLSQDEAVEVTWHLMEKGALRFLSAMLDGLDLASYSKLDARQRIVLIQDLLARFPNATSHIDFAEPNAVGFTVTACAFARLTREVGHPELAPLFCKVDEAYFASRGMRFERSTTLAKGGPSCPFRLSLEAEPTR